MPDGAFRTEAHAVLFGFPPERVDVTILPRSKSWRVAGAARTMGIALVLAPLAAVVPPHAPWVIGALAAGAILARRRWTEHFTVLSIEGDCPKCSKPIQTKGGRLRRPHPLPCEECHLDSTLQLADGALDAAVAAEG